MADGGAGHEVDEPAPDWLNRSWPRSDIASVDFKILDRLRDVETIATGRGIRELGRLRRIYGPGRWRKRKGIARVQLRDGTVRLAEIHWYEAHGIGGHEHKIKRYLD
jgi:hypothetical protein